MYMGSKFLEENVLPQKVRLFNSKDIMSPNQPPVEHFHPSRLFSGEVIQCFGGPLGRVGCPSKTTSLKLILNSIKNYPKNSFRRRKRLFVEEIHSKFPEFFLKKHSSLVSGEESC